MRADVALVRCVKGQGLFGMRIEERSPSSWWMTWAFCMNESRSTREDYSSTQIQGSLSTAESWPGCPYCGNQQVVQCGQCAKLTCWTDSTRDSTCAWCGSTGTVEAEIDSLETGGDR
jgi:hypothetical protein